MVNERKTEIIVREKLRKLGYFDNNEIIVEEQKSDNKIITDLLSKASKSGNGAGYPEFFIRGKNSDVLIIIECKANTKFHESEKKDKQKDYAVDGVLHYSSFLKDSFHIIAIAVSGDERDNRISTFQWNKEEKRFLARKFGDLQKYEDYYEVFHAKDKVLLTEDELMQYAKKLHDQMRDEVKLKEAEKPLLVASLLLALDNDDFVRELSTIHNPKKLAIRIIESIQESLEKSGILKTKIDTLIGEFSFIKTHTYLTSGEIDHQNPSHDNNSLHKFLIDIKNKVYPFVKKVNNIDIIGKFYSEFLRYTGGDGKGLGIVLTPTHITDLFCDLAEVNKNSKVLDICTGTGGFLISAMKKMIENDPTVAEIDYIYKNSLVGVESQTNMFALAVANMIIRGDGKTNMFQTNCFDIKTEELRKFGCNVGLINPPYSQKKEGEMELCFVKKMLDSLAIGGIGVAIIPQSCIYFNKTNNDLKKEILKYHTLKAVISMPDELFYPVSTITCILVFEAHKHHSKNKSTWFGYLKNDGFLKIKNKGRIDLNKNYENKIKPLFLDAFYNKKELPGLSVIHNVDENDEWLAEVYLKTDYSKIEKKDFLEVISNYFSYLAGELNFKEIDEIKNNEKKNLKLNFNNWEYIYLIGENGLFNIKKQSNTMQDFQFEEGLEKINIVSSSGENNGISKGWGKTKFNSNVLTIASNGSVGSTFYQNKPFSATSDVNILLPKFHLNVFIGLFLSCVIMQEKYRFSYGRKLGIERAKQLKIKLPFKDGKIDFEFMENYIKSLPYSESL